MIKQATTHDKPEFGKDFKTKKKRVQKEKPVAPPTPTPKQLCAFQVLEVVNEISPKLALMGSSQCKREALENGWCAEHQHAQDGMKEGERLGYRSFEIPVTQSYGDEEPFKIIIGWGKQNWLAYFERARGSGLAKVLDYLRKQ